MTKEAQILADLNPNKTSCSPLAWIIILNRNGLISDEEALLMKRKFTDKGITADQFLRIQNILSE